MKKGIFFLPIFFRPSHFPAYELPLKIYISDFINFKRKVNKLEDCYSISFLCVLPINFKERGLVFFNECKKPVCQKPVFFAMHFSCTNSLNFPLVAANLRTYVVVCTYIFANFINVVFPDTPQVLYTLNSTKYMYVCMYLRTYEDIFI